MNGEIDKTNQIIELLREAKNIAIVPSKVAGVDAFAAGVGLFFMLKDLNKDVTLVYPGARPDEFSDLNDVNITSNVAQRELVVSVDYSGTEASKVHYSTENDILFLTVSPVSKEFDLSKIKSEIKGYNFDLIVTIGAQIPDDFGQTFRELEGEFSKADILNLDNTDRNQRFGTINVIDSNEDSLSLLVLNKAPSWELKVGSRAAEALLKGISRRKGI
jgi:nanoRNase/pAp phosphatase (c-di-AMP/oligoRNAs hydrolase)